MNKEISNTYLDDDDIGDFDFFDFSDVDPIEVKKASVAANLSSSHTIHI